MMEGAHDETYCQLADDLYRRRTGLTLLDADFAVFATGKYGDGGVWHLDNNARTLATVMATDPLDVDGRDFRIVAVFDDDHDGRKQFQSLTNPTFSPWKAYRHAFLLKRFFPRSDEFRQDPEYAVTQANLICKGMDCEIEDLLGRELLEQFRKASPNASAKSPVMHVRGEIHHYEWTRIGKDHLAQFAKQHATLDDVGLIVELMKSMRWVLDLPAEGSTPS
jgi:hypothetical protein